MKDETPFTWSECLMLGITLLLSAAILGVKGYQLYCVMVGTR